MQINQGRPKSHTNQPNYLKKSDQIPKLYAVQHIETNFHKTIKSTNAHNWGYKWGHHIQT